MPVGVEHWALPNSKKNSDNHPEYNFDAGRR